MRCNPYHILYFTLCVLGGWIAYGPGAGRLGIPGELLVIFRIRGPLLHRLPTRRRESRSILDPEVLMTWICW